MKRKNKEINIFSMSALDLFASAMGAFLLIAVMALPYYLKTDKGLMEENQQLKKDLKKCKATVETLTEANQNLEARLEESQAQTAQCKKKLKQTFIAIVAQWGEAKIDVDLHIVDPSGNKYNFSKHNRTYSHYPNSRAKLSRDTTKGPGVEVWEAPLAKQGVYKVYYKYYAQHNGASVVNVSGNIYTKNGSNSIPKTSLVVGQTKKVANITISSNGDIAITTN